MKNSNARGALTDLETFRAIAEAMRGDEPADWQWIGRWESQRHFGITEARAKALAAKHGGEASKMTEAS
jgi:hypothetical protein